MEQAALDSAKLVGWTKGFDVAGVMGRDVVALLSGEGEGGRESGEGRCCCCCCCSPC